MIICVAVGATAGKEGIIEGGKAEVQCVKKAKELGLASGADDKKIKDTENLLDLLSKVQQLKK